jgi:hypothetical protein
MASECVKSVIKASDFTISNKPMLYSCKVCDFSAVKRGDYNRHVLTKKHISMKITSITSFTNILHHCEICEFTGTTIRDYMRHVATSKHRTAVLESCHTKTYTCIPCNFACNRQCDYTRHLITSKHTSQQSSPSSIESEPDPPTGFDTIMQCVQTMMTTQASTHAAQMLAQSEAHAAAQAEQTRLLVESISLSGSRSITNNNTTNNNTQFNLNVFLNEDCKNAYTLKEVVDSIECTVMDLDRMDIDGYAATVIRKILESMQNMSITERPIHCTDARRNTVCVKNETGWDKNEAATKSLNDTVYIVGRKLNNAVFAWREAYPDHYRGTKSRRDQYHRLITDVLKVSDLKVEAKIVSVVCKGIVLDRKTAAVQV